MEKLAFLQEYDDHLQNDLLSLCEKLSRVVVSLEQSLVLALIVQKVLLGLQEMQLQLSNGENIIILLLTSAQLDLIGTHLEHYISQVIQP